MLLKMHGELDLFNVKCIFGGWRDSVQADKKHLLAVSKGAEKVLAIHTWSARKLVGLLGDQVNLMILHVTFVTWEHQLTVWTSVKTVNYNHAVDQAVLLWGQGDDTLMLQAIFHAWITTAREDLQADIRVHELAERERLEQIHDEKMKRTLLMMDGKNTKFLQQCLLQAWQQYTYEVRH